MSEILNKDHAGASNQALQQHYDLGNDFYTLWLDQEITSYTCALYERADETLEEAQLRKADYHCQQVHVRGAQRVLDVGCGWGGLPKLLVDRYDVKQVVGLTLNQAHVDFVAAFGMPQVEVRLENWNDHRAEQTYDAVFAWGVLEHAVRPDVTDADKTAAYRKFFRLCHGWLKPGGWISLQTIAYGNMRREDSDRFISEHIFPESDLPSLAEIARASERLFEIKTMRNDREDYVRTCREWLARLKARRAEAVTIVGEDVAARFEKYLKFSILGFHLGTTHLLRLAMRRIDKPRD